MIGLNSSALATGVRRSNARAICTCKHCGISFKPKAFDRVTYCSRDCSFKAKAQAKIIKPPSIKDSIQHCKGCGAEFVAKRAGHVYCCKSCRPKEKTVWVSIMPTSKVCKCCGKEYKPISTGGMPSDYCSDKCRESVSRIGKRIQKAKRKAMLKGATVESVDPFRVFDRDKWKCKLCGVSTPRRKRGTYSDNAPELDHILPLSKGGEHSYVNTQCSCRRCNGLKSAEPRGQMLMFG